MVRRSAFSTDSDESPMLRNRFHDQPTSTYTGAAAYCEQVKRWVAQAHCMNVLAQHSPMVPPPPPPHLAMGSMTWRTTGPVTTTIRHNTTVIMVNEQRFISSTYKVASFTRRAMAELIDCFLMFCLKLLVVFFLIQTEALDLTPYEKLLSNEADIHTLINATQDLFPLEVAGKIMSTLLESTFISFGYILNCSGSSPGKYLMGIKVISAQSVAVHNQPGMVVVTGLERVPFKLAFMRSLVKNLVVNMLLPMSIFAYAFQHNRSIYDVLGKTIVVEC